MDIKPMQAAIDDGYVLQMGPGAPTEKKEEPDGFPIPPEEETVDIETQTEEGGEADETIEHPDGNNGGTATTDTTP